uniref:Uncharacterized protein n=1 Tax=Onchocerca volvulus TaxID=6282 RepID=A0A8R1TT83_ONCVO
MEYYESKKSSIAPDALSRDRMMIMMTMMMKENAKIQLLEKILSVLMTINSKWTLLSKLDMVDDIHPRCPRMNRE